MYYCSLYISIFSFSLRMLVSCRRSFSASISFKDWTSTTQHYLNMHFRLNKKKKRKAIRVKANLATIVEFYGFSVASSPWLGKMD